MENPRKYGHAPFGVAVIHGGPGAPGGMAPVARELSALRGILEPLQTATSFEGQILELKSALERHADIPAALVGHSYGAVLSYCLAADFPRLVSKLVLVSSGPFEKRYAEGIMETRLGRLSREERSQATALMKYLSDAAGADKTARFWQLGRLFERADSCAPLPVDVGTGDELALNPEASEDQYRIHRGVWAEVERLRASGELLERGRHIRCPVVAIHGDYDPHPAEGVREPLASVIGDFRFLLLKDCGHEPWIERAAKAEFFRILAEELA